MGRGVVGNGCLDSSRQRSGNCVFEEFPQITGPRLATRLGGVTHVSRPPGSLVIPRSRHNLISVHLGPVPGMQVAVGSDRLMVFDAVPGTILIAPSGASVRSSWPCARESITVILPEAGVAELLAEEAGRGIAGFSPLPLGTTDGWVLTIAEQLRTELADARQPNELLVESLIAVLGVHLLRNQSGNSRTTCTANGGLSKKQIKLVTDYLEDNFASKISVADLAAIAGLSRHYFIQAFARSFGKTPHGYVIDRRLNFAEELILKGDHSIANIAYLSGFSSQSHLTATMRKNRNRTPMQLRRSR